MCFCLSNFEKEKKSEAGKQLNNCFTTVSQLFYEIQEHYISLNRMERVDKHMSELLCILLIISAVFNY